MPDTPDVRRTLRQELRRWRTDAGFTQRDVAERLVWSPSKVIRIEKGEVGISVNDLRALLDLYDVGEKDPLIELARAARKAPWWNAYRDKLTSSFLRYVGIEASASHVSHFQGMIVPGLLQTMDYAREALLGTLPGPISDADVAERLEIRQHRQTDFFSQDLPPELSVVVDEAVVRRVVGSPKIWRAQLSHLLDMADRPRLTVQVVPFARGIHPGHIGPFILTDFDELPSVVYLEGPLNDALSERPEEAEGYRATFDRLRSMALSPDETSDFIRRAASELD